MHEKLSNHPYLSHLKTHRFFHNRLLGQDPLHFLLANTLDTRIDTIPAWLTDWEATGDKVKKWKSGGKKFRAHPTGEWPFYPRLKEGDIEHEYWSGKKMYHQAFLEDRKGRVVVTMDGDRYDEFLGVVKKKKGNIWTVSVDTAMQEAVNDWIVKEE